MKNNTYINFTDLLSIVVITLLLITTSCKKVPLTNGDVVTVTRDIPAFNSLSLYNNIDATLIKSDCYKIELTTCENLIDNIISEVNDSLLILRNDNTINWIRDYDYPLKVTIYYDKQIRKINYASVGYLRSDDYIVKDSISTFELIIEDGGGEINLNLRCKHLIIDSNGGATGIKLKGRSRTSDIRQDSYGPIHLDEFISDTVKAYNIGANDIYLHCNYSLSSYIYSSGNIYYKGKPIINSHISPYATGKLISTDN